VNSNQIFSRVWAAFDEGEIMTACAWCGRVRLDGGWRRPPVAVVDAIDSRLAFSHSICDECAGAYPSPPAPVPTVQVELDHA
jgi:hypothetical protein